MLEFLYKHNSLITHSIEALAAMIGFLCIRKYKGTAASFFIYILIYLFIIELIGMYPTFYNDFEFLKPIKESAFKSNKCWYTIFFDIICIALFSILYLKILKTQLFKSILKYGTIIYIVVSIILIYNNIETLFNGNFPLLYILQTVIILSCAVFYFIEIIKSENVLLFYKSVYFYISIAIFGWWLVVTPLVFFDKYYILEDRSFILLKRSIYIFANIFMYSTFAIGLIVSKPEKST